MAGQRGANRNIPPLLIAGLAMLALLAVLPSALNLPNTSPTETLELAPIPPQDDDAPSPPLGNFASLGLGSSGSLSGQADGSAPGDAGGGAVNSGAAVKTASTKRCVGNPPRQTEDVSAPPCVASFTGDNGGATYQGVTGEEIRILLHLNTPYADVGSRGAQERPPGALFDMAEPLPEEDNQGYYWLQTAKIWQRYFNERFQTYGRFAHFYVSFGTGELPEEHKADASHDYNRVRPFALILASSAVSYADVMTRKGVLVFGIASQLPEEILQRYSGHAWTYWPSVEIQARQFVDYVCTKVVPHPASFGDNDSNPDSRLHNGSPRRIGLLWVDSETAITQRLFTDLTRKGIKACGGNIVDEGTYSGYGAICCDYTNEQAGSEVMARFVQNGVTTIVWPQGFAPELSRSAARLNYYPEWIVAGDRDHEDIVAGKYQDQRAWSHAVVVTNVPLTGPIRSQICVQAVKEVEPEQPSTDLAIPCRVYNDFRQLFTGIQVAGPKLTPASLEKGFRAIPDRPSGSPTVPACFYSPGDYTCVKDSVAQYWDPTATSGFSSSTGCYRVPQGGRRYLIGEWEPTNVTAERGPNDPCNGYTGAGFTDPSPGPDSPTPQ